MDRRLEEEATVFVEEEVGSARFDKYPPLVRDTERTSDQVVDGFFTIAGRPCRLSQPYSHQPTQIPSSPMTIWSSLKSGFDAQITTFEDRVVWRFLEMQGAPGVCDSPTI